MTSGSHDQCSLVGPLTFFRLPQSVFQPQKSFWRVFLLPWAVFNGQSVLLDEQKLNFQAFLFLMSLIYLLWRVWPEMYEYSLWINERNKVAEDDWSHAFVFVWSQFFFLYLVRYLISWWRNNLKHFEFWGSEMLVCCFCLFTRTNSNNTLNQSVLSSSASLCLRSWFLSCDVLFSSIVCFYCYTCQKTQKLPHDSHLCNQWASLQILWLVNYAVLEYYGVLLGTDLSQNIRNAFSCNSFLFISLFVGCCSDIWAETNIL